MPGRTGRQAILYGTLVVGTLDALDAIVFFGLRSGARPIRIFQGIASGLIHPVVEDRRAVDAGDARARQRSPHSHVRRRAAQRTVRQGGEAMIDRPLTPSADAEIRALIQEHRKIHAIKLVREKTGLGLKEAKDRVEAMERDMGWPPASTMPGSPGGLVLAAIVLITGLLAWWWLRG